MAKKAKLTNEEQVAAYMKKLEHPLIKIVEALRKVILSADKEISGRIKWNSPAFYYSGEMKPFDPREYKRDIVVFNLYRKEFVMLVFPTGATVNDKSGLLEGNFSDKRKIIKFATLAEVKKRQKDLKEILKQWIKLADK